MAGFLRPGGHRSFCPVSMLCGFSGGTGIPLRVGACAHLVPDCPGPAMGVMQPAAMAVAVAVAVVMAMPMTARLAGQRAGCDLRLMCALLAPLMGDSVVWGPIGNKRRANDSICRFAANWARHCFRRAAHGLKIGKGSALAAVVVIQGHWITPSCQIAQRIVCRPMVVRTALRDQAMKPSSRR